MSRKWITDDMFDERLLEILQTMSTGAIMQIPGVYEIVAEELNNEVLESLEQDRACAPSCELVEPGFQPGDDKWPGDPGYAAPGQLEVDEQ